MTRHDKIRALENLISACVADIRECQLVIKDRRRRVWTARRALRELKEVKP
jgi:hypothetical protein